MAKPEAIDRIAYFGRVSTPKQKMEHQRESVMRFAEAEGLTIPDNRRFEDKVRRHQLLTDGKQFAEMMKLVKAGQVDWIIVATFDRFGISDKDDIFVWRKELRKYDVKLWSVADELDITGDDDSSFWRVAARAEAATSYVSQQADKNIQKMVLMAEQGWATSGNAAYGLDLVCYSVKNTSKPLFRVIRTRYKKPHTYRIQTFNEKGVVVKEETTHVMPPRDKKETGYRYEPSVEKKRIEAVKLMFDLFLKGFGFAEISEHLWKLGYGHYDKPFGYHGVEVILKNPAYIGKPAFGKNGVGQYRIVQNKQPAKVKRKANEPHVIKRPVDQWVMPSKPLFDPIISEDQFNQVQRKLAEREHVNESFGKRRTRDRITHPLNGKLWCPDCQAPMVQGSFMPGKAAHGKAHKCFHCGTWRRTIRTQCNANTVRWELLDKATDELLKVVSDRITATVTMDTTVLQEQEWLAASQLGKLVLDILRYLRDAGSKKYQRDIPPSEYGQRSFWQEVYAEYNRRFEKDGESMKKEMADIEAELDTLADLLVKQANNKTMYAKLNAKIEALEARKAEIEPKLVPLTSKVDALLEQLKAVKALAESQDKAKRSQLLDMFVEKVEPVFQVKEIGKDKRRRTEVIGIRFWPKKEAESVFSEVMEMRHSRRDTGSSTHTG